MTDGMGELTAATGAEPPAEFGVLSPSQLAGLAATVEQAARSRSRAIDSAIDESLRYIPGMLRGTVKRALGV
jgi:hypothetical protein